MKTRAIAIITCEVMRIVNKSDVVDRYRGKEEFERNIKRQNQ